SHEVRTPLNGVLGCLSLLELTSLDESQKRYLGLARASAENLLGMLTDVLDYAALEVEHEIAAAAGDEPAAVGSSPPSPADPIGSGAPKPVAESIEVDVGELVGSVVEAARSQVEAAGLGLRFEIADTAPRRVRVDGHRLSRVLANLLENARKFTRQGGISVHLGAEGEQLRIAVRDTGPGVDRQDRERIFEPFFQADGGTTREAGGMGLGLALSRRLVEAMGGALELATATGPGAEMLVSLPVEVVGPTPAPEAEAADTARRALVADDDPTNCLLLGRMLERLGYDVTRVVNGLKAVEAVEARAFAVVLLDYQMPVLDGAAAAIEIRRLEARLARPPAVLVAITGFSLEEYERRCRAAGFDHFVTKPLTFATLARLAASWPG
ncbi:MAG: ATP-binding protein, partial [Holophagales bacterium]|nr:ATP-binding protein [Holophagales bacterium]